MDGFGAQEAEGELTLGHGSAIAETFRDCSGGGAFAIPPDTAPRAFAVSAQTLAPPPTPLNTIIARLETAVEALNHANERLAGASGRLGTANPGRDPRGTGEAANNGPGFIGTANDRIDYLISCIEATSTLASVFSEAV